MRGQNMQMERAMTRSTHTSRTPLRYVLAVGVLCAALLLPACNQTKNPYLARRDGITLGLGDAKEANRVVHTVDPWPAYSGNRKLTTNGDRVLVGIERYRTNTSLEPKGATTTDDGEANADSPPAPPAAAQP